MSLLEENGKFGLLYTMTEIGIVALGVAFLAAIPPTLVGWAALNSSRANSKKADALAVKTDEIHIATNANLSDVKKDLAAANGKIDGLDKLVAALAERTAPIPSDVPPRRKLRNPKCRSG